MVRFLGDPESRLRKGNEAPWSLAESAPISFWWRVYDLGFIV